MRFLFLLALCGLPLLLTGCANGMFYFPDHVDYEPRLVTPVVHNEVWIKTSDGLSINGWWLPAQTSVEQPAAKATVVFLHGNAQNLTAHVAYVDWLPAAGYNVLIVDYRGYGRSPGQPSRQGVLDDARAAYFFAHDHPGVNPEKMILFGQSLGGANALTLAGRERLPGLKAVVADSAFSNYGRIAREKMAQIPVLVWLLWPFSPLIVSSGLSPDRTVDKIAPTPLLLIAGDHDEVVPPSHSERLYQMAGNPRQLWMIQGAGHTEAFGRFRAIMMPPLLQFLDDALNDDASRQGSSNQVNQNQVNQSQVKLFPDAQGNLPGAPVQ